MNAKLQYQRKSLLNKSISNNREKNLPIELIVKSEFGKRDALARELERVGRITRMYKSIPYLSFQCDATDAHELSSTFHKLAENKAYLSMAMAISGIDVSSRVEIPKVSKSSKKMRKSGLWNLDDIGAYSAKSIAQGEGISIAIIDTGIDYNHPEI